MKTQRRSRRSREEWQQLIQAQTEGEQTETEFCTQRSISLSRFSHWKRRLQTAHPKLSDSHWLELPTLPATAASGWEIELELGNGLCLRLHKH